MNTFTISVDAFPADALQVPLGIRAENEVSAVALDFSAWAEEFGAGIVQLLLKRAGDAAPYPVIIAQSGTTATWTVTATDLAYKGELLAEWSYRVGEQLKKSAVLRFFVVPDIGVPGTPPEPYEDWLEQLEELAGEVQAATAETQALALNAYPHDTVTGSVANFSDGGNDLPVRDLSVAIAPVQDLHGYDSPWPAGGGKNKLPDKSYQQTANNLIVGADSNSYTIALDAGTYTFAVNCTKAVGLYFQRSTDGSSTSVLGSGGSTGVRSGQFTLSEAATCKFWLYISGGVSADDVSWWQVEKNASFTSYAPYSNVCPITGWTGVNVYHSGADTSDPETIAVSWQTEAGTVYGGTLDVTTGLLTVTDANIASYAGETLPGAWISDRDVYSEGGTPTTGAQVVYKLATPLTYQLTPTEVKTLLGENNVWADTGDTTVDYRADTTLFVQKAIAAAVAAL